MENVLGFLAPIIIYAIIFILNAILPGRWVLGYATKEGTDEKLKYRLNGFLVLVTSVTLWGGLCYFNFLPWDWFIPFVGMHFREPVPLDCCFLLL